MVVRQPLPFRYPGGKYYALEILRPFWEAIAHDEYREPMVGGGSIFFNKPRVQFNWLNDLDDELICTYKVLSHSKLRIKLLNMFKDEVATKERWRSVFELKPKNELEVAFKYYYLNRTSFSGKLISPAWGYRPKRSLPPDRWHERILPCGKTLEDVQITCEDFEKVVREKRNGKVTLLYLDPPYFKPPKKKHYRNGFSQADHVRLASVLKTSKHKFFLTYDDCEEVRKLYSWANIHEVNFFYRVDNAQVFNGKRRVGFELVITNYVVPNSAKGRST
ncbi:MAG: DNA adenine methylase [Candidatus Omnitrophica bacterium]|nr:DNA adenine methylase [Candidatus Omnitrophota bacterium]